MAQTCVHKGCGKSFTSLDDPCIYHPGPPVFHEGQKGWKCCKPRVLTFDEFLSIPPCTTGTHSTVDDTPAAPDEQGPAATLRSEPPSEPSREPISAPVSKATATPTNPPPPPEPDTEDDDPSLEIAHGAACRRRGCKSTYDAANQDRLNEKCVFHSGHPIFHEGAKGWSCCKRRVTDFNEFLDLAGCQSKDRHLFVGSGRKSKKSNGDAKQLDSVRHDFYQTGDKVHVSLYLKKISKTEAKVQFTSATTVDVDLPTADGTRYKATLPLYGAIKPEECDYRILGTKMEMTLVKADGAGWPVLRSDERQTGEIIQTGRAGRA